MSKEPIQKILKKIILLELVVAIFPIMYLVFIWVTGVRDPILGDMIWITIVTSLILMGGAVIVFSIGRGLLKKFYDRAVWFLYFDYDKNIKNKSDRIWFIRYIIFSGLYFFIFSVYFYFAGFKRIEHVIFLSWFGLIFIRSLHYIPQSVNRCREIGKILISTFIPFGILLEIGLIYFKDVKIIWAEMNVYIFFSISFLVATLVAEILISIVMENIKKSQKE